jgi:hypothetical protein
VRTEKPKEVKRENVSLNILAAPKIFESRSDPRQLNYTGSENKRKRFAKQFKKKTRERARITQKNYSVKKTAK